VPARGLWIYAVAERVTVPPGDGLRGVGEGPLRTVPAAGLTTVAQDVDLAEFGEATLRRNLEDLSWLEATARAHHRVIDALAPQGPLVPMRLATVYRSEASLVAMITSQGTDLRAALDRISGRAEWGVKAYEARRPEPAASPASAGPARPGTGAGAAYLRRRRDELAAQQGARRDVLAGAQAIHHELSRYAAGARLHPPQPAQLTGTSEPMILNAAYLLDESRGEDFAAAVAALGERYPGVRLGLTGPWPAYSFAGIGEKEN
jgi:Gas vesicle synthesis protein GvpL/GvpF